MFFCIFDEALPFLTTYTYVAGFCSEAVLYTLHGERPPAILRDGRGI